MIPARSLRLLGRKLLPFGRHYSGVAKEELYYPEARSTDHHDLASFLEYASRTGKDPHSTVHVGTHYEYTVLAALERLGISLQRTGGASDYGIDLLGTWPLPSVVQPLKVLVQCKATARSINPAQARELEGAFAGAPQGWRGSGVLGLLVSQKPATKGVLKALGNSELPMGYVLCNTKGKLLQMMWNQKADREVLAGIGVEAKYAGGDKNEKEIVLTWKHEVFHG